MLIGYVLTVVKECLCFPGVTEERQGSVSGDVSEFSLHYLWYLPLSCLLLMSPTRVYVVSISLKHLVLVIPNGRLAPAHVL